MHGTALIKIQAKVKRKSGRKEGRKEGGREGGNGGSQGRRTLEKFPLISVIQWQACVAALVSLRACGPHAVGRYAYPPVRVRAFAWHFRSYLMTSSMDLTEGERGRGRGRGGGEKARDGGQESEMGREPKMPSLANRPTADGPADRPRERPSSSCESNLASPS